MIPTAQQNRVRGCVLGSIVGDAFGAPLEGASQSGIERLVEQRVRSHDPWGYTDDGAMTIAVAESLLEANTIDPTNLLQRMSEHYEPARGFGRGMKIAISAFVGGTPWNRCAFAAWPEGSRGNGGAVRIGPVAAVRWADPDAFNHAVKLATRVTHAHPDAVACAQLQACAVAAILDEPSVADDVVALRHAIITPLDPLPSTVDRLLESIMALLERGATPLEAAKALGTSTLAIESVPVALWSFLKRHASFSEAISAAALLGGDVDSICSLVGTLAGAYHGAGAIDPQWVNNLRHERPSPTGMEELADRLVLLNPISPVEAA